MPRWVCESDEAFANGMHMDSVVPPLVIFCVRAALPPFGTYPQVERKSTVLVYHRHVVRYTVEPSTLTVATS